MDAPPGSSTVGFPGKGEEEEEGITFESNHEKMEFQMLVSALNGSKLPTRKLQLLGTEVKDSILRMSYCGTRRDLRMGIIDAACHSASLIGFDIQGMTQDEARALCRNLETNTVLRDLSIWNSQEGVGNETARVVSEMLKRNYTLQSLGLCVADVGVDGAACLREMLQHNSTLQNLDLTGNRGMGKEGVKHVTEPLMANEQGQQANTSLKFLALVSSSLGGSGGAAEVIAEALRRNRTLTHLSLAFDRTWEPGDVCKILKSLESNASLQCLDLSGCEGVKGERVYAAVMDLLQVNLSLKDIRLLDTPLGKGGQGRAIKTQLKRNAQSQHSLAFMQDLPTISPKYARIFLCGHALSGKTTLRKSMARNLNSTWPSKLAHSIFDHFRLQKHYFQSRMDPNEWSTRTRGIEFEYLINNKNYTISLWDLAGHEEYHAFHNLMIPDFSDRGNPSCFLVLCNPFDNKQNKEKSQEVIKEELSYWLRFIASNTKRSLLIQPQVTIAFTHADVKSFEGRNLVTKCVEQLKDHFQEYIMVSSTVHFVNAHASQSKEIQCLAKEMKDLCKTILDGLPKVYEDYIQVRQTIIKWNKNHFDKPLIRKGKFKNIIQQVESMRSNLGICTAEEISITEQRQNTIALLLHEVGDIIYFDDEDFVVVNPLWFCHDVIGEIITFNNKKYISNSIDGIIDEIELEDLLLKSLQKKFGKINKKQRHLDVKDEFIRPLIQLMNRLGMCYNHKKSTILIPMTFKDQFGLVSRGERQLYFKLRESIRHDKCDHVYLGRRLQCAKPMLTTLTPSFFPKLQVELYKYFENFPTNTSYDIEKNLIKIIIGGIGMEVLVELSGEEMNAISHIDILVLSTKPHLQTLDFVQKHVLRKIQDLWYSSHGSQGVILQEAILRPQCVESLTLCKHRTAQSVLVEELKREFLASGGDLSHKYLWTGTMDNGVEIMGPSCSDLAVDLLGERDTKEILHCQKVKLDKLNTTITDLVLANTTSQEVDLMASTRRSMNGTVQRSTSLSEDPRTRPILDYMDIRFGHVDRRFDQLDEKLEANIVDEIRIIRNDIIDMEKRVWKNLSERLQDIQDSSFQILERQVPCNVYFTEANSARRFITQIHPGYTSVRLHLLCEHRHGIHVIDDQKGVVVSLASEFARRYVEPLINGSLLALSILLKVSSRAIGNMVPNIGTSAFAAMVDRQVISDQITTSGLQAFEKDPGVSQLDRIAALASEKSAAVKWLVDFLKARDIGKDFGLMRIRYVEGRGSEQIRWVCGKHRKDGLRNGTLRDFVT